MKHLLVIIMVTIASCETNNSPETRKDTVLTTDTPAPSIEVNTTLPRNNDSTIYVRFLPDSTATTVAATLQKNSPVNFYVDVQSGKKLRVTLQLVTLKLNARINQVLTPSGKADGPFGNQLDYSISEKGMYKIVVGRNLMAEGAASGKFSLRVSVDPNDEL